MSALSNINVCFLAGTLEHGGAERQLFYMLQTFRQAGAFPQVLSLDGGEFWEDKIKALGVPVTCVGGEASRLKRLFRVVKAIRTDPPDVLQSQHFFANAYAGLAARLSRISGIGAMRSAGHMEMSRCGRSGGWLNLHCPQTIAANSHAAIQYAIAEGISPSRLHFLPNVVDTDQFQPANGLEKEPVTLITVGRLSKEKRLDRFVTILSRLRTIYRLNVRGLIVGPGCQNDDLQPELERQAWQFGMFQDVLQFCGGVSDTRAAYRRAHICVLTSDYEGTPNVLLEAMACGLPVVASNVGGVPDIVQPGQTGYLLEPDDLEGFTSALAGLVKDAALRAKMGRQARAFVEEHHSLHRLSVYLEGLYRQALPARRSEATAFHPLKVGR